MQELVAGGVAADRVLVLVPQRTLGQPYYDALRRVGMGQGGLAGVVTLGGLARRMIDLFWPLVAETVGFAHPDKRPTFLTLETAQYFMARVIGPLIETEGYFDAVTIDRNRLYSQILDNLNKAAVVGFPITEIAERLRGAWIGERAQAQVYDHAEVCALHFRHFCLEHNLLDFSLQMTVFADYLWQEPLCREHLVNTYTHLIADNVEEDTPVAHDVVYSWLPEMASALVIFDEGAGYRSFLGADPASSRMLQDLCHETVTFDHSFVMSAPVQALCAAMDRALPRVEDAPPLPRENVVISAPDPKRPGSDRSEPGDSVERSCEASDVIDYRDALFFEDHRFHPQMLDWVADEIAGLVHEEGTAPGEIVVLAPFLTDALRFSLSHRLARHGVAVRSHRPSRALRDEPATQTLLTLAALAHPDWELLPTRYDVAYAFMQAIGDLDLIRAQLLAEIAYRREEGKPVLAPFDGINPDMQQRITFILGGRYEALRTWMRSYASRRRKVALDHFLARLFGEVLSQPGFGFHRDIDSGRVAAMLIESVRKFRWISQDIPRDLPVGKEYLQMVQQGVIAAQYLAPWRRQTEDAVLLAPAYTFLLNNRPVDVQFWLNVGGRGWWERLYQPLTHPYVLSRRWPVGKDWTDADEYALRQRTLRRLILGLLRRCRKSVYLGLSELSEQGFEQEGALLRVVQRVLRRPDARIEVPR
jgi:hypothetical protein